MRSPPIYTSDHKPGFFIAFSVFGPQENLCANSMYNTPLRFHKELFSHWRHLS